MRTSSMVFIVAVMWSMIAVVSVFGSDYNAVTQEKNKYVDTVREG